MNILVTGAIPPFSPNLWFDLQTMWQYGFMRNALLAATMLSLVTGMIGYFVVLRHQSFAGESLSDVAFTGALGGAAFGWSPFVSLLIVTVAVALGMGWFGERLRGRDVAIGTVLAWVLGLGSLFLSLFTTGASGTGTGFSGVTVLFGNILGTSTSDLQTIALVSGLVVVVLLCIGRPLLFSSLDGDVAAARGVPVRALGLIFMALLAITVGEATMAVGALLVFALLLLPAATVYQLTLRPVRAILFSALLALVLSWIGITIGFYTSIPTSVCIALLSFLCYVLVVGGVQLRRARLLIVASQRVQ